MIEDSKVPFSSFTLDLLCDGNVPAGGGLSSSAAMVIASSIATLQALNQLENVTRTSMTEIAIVSERLVGVNSGGCASPSLLYTRWPHERLRIAWIRQRASLGRSRPCCTCALPPRSRGKMESQSRTHSMFVPELTSRPVEMPSSLAFVIANSLVTAEKQSTSKRNCASSH